MKITAAVNQSFSLDAGGLRRISVWRLYGDSPETAPDTFAEEVAAWCGETGQNLRVPAGTGEPAALENFPVDKIEVKSLTPLSCEVTFSAGQIDTEPIFSEIRSADGKKRKSAKYTVKTDTPDTLLPLPGAVLEWNGESFYCEQSSYSPVGAGLWRFEVTAIPAAGTIISLPSVSVDSDNRRTVSCSWSVTPDEYGALLDSLQIDSPAPWAGEGFSLRSVSSKTENASSILVTAVAREVETRMLKCIRKEKFAGFDDDGNPLHSIEYESLWRVRSEDMADFTGITGTAAEWAASNSVVSSVSPEKISPLEYEITMKAELLNNPDLYKKYSFEDRQNLSSRNDVSACMVEFMVTPEMAGWRTGFDGIPEMCPDWEYGANCPFTVDEPLPEAMINRALKCALLEVTEYRRGGMSRHIDRLLEWSASDRVLDGEVGGCDGSYLRVDMEAEEVFDNSGRRWTKFTGSYQRAPGDYQWNPQYWGKV